MLEALGIVGLSWLTFHMEVDSFFFKNGRYYSAYHFSVYVFCGLAKGLQLCDYYLWYKYTEHVFSGCCALDCPLSLILFVIFI